MNNSKMVDDSTKLCEFSLLTGLREEQKPSTTIQTRILEKKHVIKVLLEG